MTLNGAPPVSVLIGTRNRPEALAACLKSVLCQDFDDFEVLVLDDASDIDIASQFSQRFPDPRIRWLRSERPSGVAGARNRLIQASRSPKLLFLDDDAYFEDESCIGRAVGYFQSAPQVGIIAFKIVLRGPDEGELQVPFTRRSCRSNPILADSCRRVSYYVGAAHAIRRDVFERCGLYQDDLVYGHEELDLSYAAVQRGFQLMYATDIAVSHAPGKPVVSGRRPSDNELFYSSRNRLWVAYKHLPFPYILSYTLGWTAYYGLCSLRERSLGPYLKGVLAGIRGMSRLPRHPLGSDARRYLKGNFGRLWY
jgi:GT2 family glycosyltransferase